MTDEFMDEEQRSLPSVQRPFQEAWIKYVLEFPMPEVNKGDEVQEKRMIIKILGPLLCSAPRANLDKIEISNLLWQYDNLWMAHIAYNRKGRRNAELIELRRGLRSAYYTELTRSKEMGQMNMIFQPKQNIFQRLITGRHDKVAGFFKSKKNNEEPME